MLVELLIFKVDMQKKCKNKTVISFSKSDSIPFKNIDTYTFNIPFKNFTENLLNDILVDFVKDGYKSYQIMNESY
jgi:hypothetical protein